MTTLCAVAIAAVVLENSRPLAQSTEPRVIEITARRFSFEPSEIEAGGGGRRARVGRAGPGGSGREKKKKKKKK